MKLVQESRFKKKNFKIKPQEMMFTNQTQQKTSPKMKFLTKSKKQPFCRRKIVHSDDKP
jgi:hypothetical protein